MKYFFLAVIFFACLWLPQDSPAKYYKYVDENGVVRFTDRISEIPEDQRPEVYEAVAPDPEPDADRAEPVDDTSQPYRIDPRAYDKNSTYGRLGRTQDQLVRHQRQLMAEKEMLLQEQKNLKGKDDIAAFQQKVADLNSRITAFEQKRREYAQEADGYRTER